MTYEDTDWKQLPKKVKDAAKVLGYSPKMWDNDKEPDITKLDWKDLKPKQREAATVLGYCQEFWDDDGGDSEKEEKETITTTTFENTAWKKLPTKVQNAAKILGYTPKLWNNDKETNVTKLDWKELNSEQREAASILGYCKESWDDDDDNSGLTSDNSISNTKEVEIPSYENTSWRNLPPKVQNAAKKLGYTPRMWNNDKEPAVTKLDWDELKPEQQEAANILGYSKGTWDNDDDDDSSTSDEKSGCKTTQKRTYENTGWNQLPPDAQNAAKILGYTARLWNNDKETDITNLCWNKLKPEQQQAARTIGFCKESWDGDEDDDSSDSSCCSTKSPPNLICLQIYVETNDYLLVDKKDVGVSMLVNREMKADEIFFQSPTGPIGQEETLCRSSSSMMTKERETFANRFLKWQSTYGQDEVAVGASECNYPEFTMADFQRHDNVRPNNSPLIFSPECTATTTTTKEEEEGKNSSSSRNFCYFFQMLPQDYVLVEFIKNESNGSDKLLPPERQFEVLPYDESIHWDGENDYDPEIQKRPPKICKVERSLEIPGHFSNHASGSSATVYDQFRLTKGNEGKDGRVLIAPAQSSEFQARLDAMVNEEEEEEVDRELTWEEEYNVMTTHRSLKVGDEVLTDYVLWHWSNADYGDNENEPWFYCLCGNSKCHSSASKGGFRGAKFLPLKEQKRLYWVFSERIQNQIDWKLYQLEEETKEGEEIEEG